MTELEKIREIKADLAKFAQAPRTNQIDLGFLYGICMAEAVILTYYPDELTDVVEQESPLNE